ncbi:hypothetical protein ACS0TY_036150 [Phlomoides rotata]
MMIGSNSTPAPLFFIIFIFISSFKLSYSVVNNTTFCPEVEKQSLLSFKQSLEDPNNLLSSWDVVVNCCTWRGVTCNNVTGHVHQLHLPNIDGLNGKLNPSLLNLKYLRYLDLSGNGLFGGTIPSFIGSFANLEYLNLSYTGIHGTVPHTIGNLSNLRTLDLEGINFLVVDSLEWMTGLSQLEYLNMNYVNLSRANNSAQAINSLPSLVELHFEYCNLDFTAPPDDVNLTTSLNHLYLSHNYLSSFTIPKWIFQITNLLSLDLSSNFFDGPIPTISNATKLRHIDLSSNYLNSSIPNWLYLCKDLEFVDLSNNLLSGTISNSIANLTSLNTFAAQNNQFSGKIPKEIANLCKIQRVDFSKNHFHGEIFGNMSECFLEALVDLNLEDNQLSGHLTNQFGEFKSLRILDLGRNSFSGVVPFSIGRLSSLERLWLNDNKFTGTLPESLGQLFNLTGLFVDGNMLEGIVTETHYANLTKLEDLYASRNQLSLKVSPNWNPPFQLTSLHIASWNLGAGSKIPSWIEKQRNIVNLDLSNTGISGSIPSWVWKITFLSLSDNHLHGNIQIEDTMGDLDLSNNSFSGDISHLLCDTTYQTYGLQTLLLGGNQFSGELPDCWTKLPSLKHLNLGNNNISGSIPNSIGFLAYLRTLNLYGNRLSGEIPFSMHNCTQLRLMNLADNDLDGGIPTWVGTHLVELKYLILRSNKLSGKISPEICLLNSLQILDLSDNKLSGKIPSCLSNLSGMATERSLDPFFQLYLFYSGAVTESASIATKGSELEYGTNLPLVTNINLSKNNLSGNIPEELTRLVELRSLNLSQNRLSGSIPEKVGDMKQLESVDFSLNSLSGQIPKSMALLSFLNYLNLSYNKLTGEIPTSTQLVGLDASSFIGNSLCGPPLTIRCSKDGPEPIEENEEESVIEWVYVVASLGYAVGFSIVCSALVLNKCWREAYFGFLQSVWDKMYVYVRIKFNKRSGPEESG